LCLARFLLHKPLSVLFVKETATPANGFAFCGYQMETGAIIKVRPSRGRLAASVRKKIKGRNFLQTSHHLDASKVTGCEYENLRGGLICTRSVWFSVLFWSFRLRPAPR
jgi:hypothetical protein